MFADEASGAWQCARTKHGQFVVAKTPYHIHIHQCPDLSKWHDGVLNKVLGPEEALFLARFGRTVTIIHRRDTLRASKIMQDRAMDHDKIRFRWNTVVDDIVGETSVEGLVLRDVDTGETTTEPFTGLFVAIGHRPNTDLFKGQLELKDNGYLVTLDNTSRTDVEGVFAAGDVQDDWYRQAITAAGSGCMAAIDAERWLEEQGV